ncbi:DinB family protein [Salinimicrobium sp. HB62]|uniref:DinB family protein n=1 Tax=Salinimicrobium sp. HB62 TaxID=3077781 RepID=UPI002D76D9DE|nr:DinB family protein [Salinimicrobium sp. HB62]
MPAEFGLKKTLSKHLFGGEAFLTVDEMLNLIPFDQLSVRPHDLPYSFYELFYHIWYTQRDILSYCTEVDYSAPHWPAEYWSQQQGPRDAAEWKALKNAFFEDRQKLRQLINSEEAGLNDKVPSSEKHTLFREILLVIEHTSYHSGQLLIILRHLGLYSS